MRYEMVNSINNGHGATAVPRIKGAGIANRRADKRQLAALAAAVLEGDIGYEPSLRQLAQIFGVNPVYIILARRFSPAKRKAIITGEDVTSFSSLLNPPAAPFALPKPKLVSDQQLEDIIRIAGIDRTLSVAAAVETRVGA
jgi:hypothetical protein